MLNILFISDYVCPYCLVAKEALKGALKETCIKAAITWQPFELTMEPKPQVDTYNDPVRRSHYQILVEPCRKLDLAMKLPPNIVPRPYTRLAFEASFFAKGEGLGEEWNEAMYQAYFIDERDIGQLSVLLQIAEELGLDKDLLKKYLEHGIYTEEEHAAVMYAREKLQPTGVPTVYINGSKIHIEKYTIEEMVSILRGFEDGSIAPMQQLTIDNQIPGDGMGEADDSDFTGCGPDGCGPADTDFTGCGPDGCGPADTDFTGCGPDGCL